MQKEEGATIQEAYEDWIGFGGARITDAVAQANVKVVGEAPALSLAQSYLAASQANAVLFANMISQQQQLAIGGTTTLLEEIRRNLRD